MGAIPTPPQPGTSPRRLSDTALRRLPELAVLASAAVNARRSDSGITCRLTGNASARSGQGLAAGFGYVFATIFAKIGTVAGRKARTRALHRVGYRIVDLILHRAISCPAVRHSLSPSVKRAIAVGAPVEATAKRRPQRFGTAVSVSPLEKRVLISSRSTDASAPTSGHGLRGPRCKRSVSTDAPPDRDPHPSARFRTSP